MLLLSVQGGFFFVGDLPKRLPEQFVAILQAPLTAELRAAVRQPKATVVLVGKQSPAPVFYLLWEGKFQFVIQVGQVVNCSPNRRHSSLCFYLAEFFCFFVRGQGFRPSFRRIDQNVQLLILKTLS